ncbi:uncharacterized protein FA14DRAFT_184651 [Meira miltonrushii]|uniref:Uncharacterized protein n=1 Tax=Meira miltonrushii TaxID=1280837 RepID=A0A316VDE0_9BASI|nr:uncharacterized protein FA14DRAFT_184651 [Meira miltonrushii]PWN35510.1 hypothetical protein FA14DRAFT_184651 [Meira miltonrushii]
MFLHTFYVYFFIACTFINSATAQIPGNSDEEGYSSDEHAPKTAIGTVSYHESKLTHHQKKHAFHEAMSTHLGNTKHRRLAQDHAKEASYSKDLMAVHNHYSEGIESGEYDAGQKTTERKRTSALPESPKNPQEAMNLINKPDQPWEMKHRGDNPSKHLPDDQIEEKRKNLKQRLHGNLAGSSKAGSSRWSKNSSSQQAKQSSKRSEQEQKSGKGKGKYKRG